MKTYLRFCGLPQTTLRSAFSALVALAVYFGAAGAHATPLGFSSDPMGGAWDRSDANSGYAVWDTFSSTSFANDPPGSSGGLAGATLSQSSTFTNFAQGAGLYSVATSSPVAGNGDVMFAGGNSLNFTLAGEAQFTVYGLTLQIKRPSSNGTLADASGFIPTLSINGGPALSADQTSLAFGSGDTSSTNGLWSVTTWYWGSSLAGNADTGHDTFVVSFAKTGSQRLIDGVSIDVGNVAAVAAPEPSTWAMLIIGALFLLHRVRALRARVG